MAEWSLPDPDNHPNRLSTYQYSQYSHCYQDKPLKEPHSMPPQKMLPPSSQAQLCSSQATTMALQSAPQYPKGDNPRELRNRAEKMRRDRLNQSVRELAAMVPPVVGARRKFDKTTILRLTAHYLRAHQYVFGDSIGTSVPEFSPASALKLLSLFKGFLITTTYRGIIVVVSQNVQEYLGYTELELLGQNIFTLTHADDRIILRDHLMPKTQTFGPSGELLLSNEPDAARKAEEALSQEKRQFVIRLKKLSQRSEPNQYVWCHIQGSLRKSDRACPGGVSRSFQIVRRARARSENPCSSGNDVVFIGVVRPTSETFINESALESYRLEYRTRHSIDGQILQCESRIALVTGYMIHEVNGINAMNFMHRDDVRWVIIALRDMYDQHRLYGESCYRLMTKNGQFIYMRTRGRLDVDQESRVVTSFVCTNTVVNEKEGKHLIKLMKRRYHLLVNNGDSTDFEEEIKENNDEQVSVEHPRLLEQVILHLVTNLPSPNPNEGGDNETSENSVSPANRLNIIPPEKSRIIHAIEKIYSVIKILPKDPKQNNNRQICDSVIDEQDNQPSVSGISQGRFLMNAQEQVENFDNSYKITKVSNSTYNTYADKDVQLPSTSISSVTDLSAESLFDIEPSTSMSRFDIPSPSFTMLNEIFENVNTNTTMLNGENVADLQDIKFQSIESELNFPVPQYDEESAVFDALLEPSTSTYASGMKRPNEFEEQEILLCKRKIPKDIRSHKQNGCNSPTLESLFDGTLFNSQIEAALSSLETIDPNFQDLLSSNNVQEILGEIEQESPIPVIPREEFPNYE